MNNELTLIPLLDGRSVSIRSITPEDGASLVRFHNGLTDETTRRRFFVVRRTLSAAEVTRFTNVDHVDREALVALNGADIVAVGRYDLLADSLDAEIAFVVADDWQGEGIATYLLKQLARRARAVGITRFVADTLSENYGMRDVFIRSGLPASSKAEADVVRVVLNLGREAHPALYS